MSNNIKENKCCEKCNPIGPNQFCLKQCFYCHTPKREDYKLTWKEDHEAGKHGLKMWWCELCLLELK